MSQIHIKTCQTKNQFHRANKTFVEKQQEDQKDIINLLKKFLIKKTIQVLHKPEKIGEKKSAKRIKIN